MSTATYTVVGMTCGHCVSVVTEEVSAGRRASPTSTSTSPAAASPSPATRRSTRPPSAPPSRRPATQLAGT